MCSKKELVQLLQECRYCLSLLSDDKPCKYTYLNHCKTHNSSEPDICPNQRAQDLIALINATIGEEE